MQSDPEAPQDDRSQDRQQQTAAHGAQLFAADGEDKVCVPGGEGLVEQGLGARPVEIPLTGEAPGADGHERAGLLPAHPLGIADRVTSPTFNIVNEYEGGRLPLFHFDLYRLGGADELFDIGWEDYLARGGVCAVEWSENAQGALEGPYIKVDIRRGDSDSQRVIGIEGIEL